MPGAMASFIAGITASAVGTMMIPFTFRAMGRSGMSS
jgi:hypothetical protein